MIKAVLFDYGGVIGHGGRLGMLSNNLAVNLEVPDKHAQRLLDYGFGKIQRGLVDEAEFWRILEKAYGVEVPADKRDIWVKWEDVVPIPEVIAFRDRLKEQGIITGVLSNTEAVVVDMLRRNGAYDGFDQLILSCEVGYAKPDPEIYTFSLERLGVSKAEEVLFIDDQEKLLAPATEMGMKAVLANNPQQFIADASKLIGL